MLAYRMDVASREEMASQDPFGGHGMMLWAPGEDDGEALLARLESCAGKALPAVAWPGIGAWADRRAVEDPGELARRWHGDRMPWE